MSWIECCLQAVYRIPICGGWCAPTVNPDPTCYRRISNEWTMIGGGVFMYLAPCIEYNMCCRFVGSRGT